MTQEDEQLLLKDICARIPYGIIGAVEHCDEITKEPTNLLGALWGIDGHNRVQFAYLPEYGDDEGAYNYFDFKLFKPYLRPMSSMTEEESAELSNIIGEWFNKELLYLTEEPFLEYALWKIDYSISPLLFDWLNKNMFDYRGLIPKGLAVEVTKDNNPYKD